MWAIDLRTGSITTPGSRPDYATFFRRVQARDAVSGLKNEGQFLATLHASKDLNIPFDRKAEKEANETEKGAAESLHS